MTKRPGHGALPTHPHWSLPSIALKRHQQRTGQEIYAKLFGEFCWELNVPRYDALPASQYADALAWLRRKATELGYPDIVQEQQEGMF